MIDVRKFIERLNKEQSNYTSPELSQNIANALESLSTDIYTDSKRFIYEMLQNADDASNRSGKLEIQIQIIGQYLVISHQGEKFTEIDIESICSVGDGNKKGDENKTGFKGIGFKSIFSHSDYVIAYWDRNSENDVDLARGQYQVQISTSSSFATIVEDTVITGTVATFNGLTTGTLYYVRVRATDSSGNSGPWSSIASTTPSTLNAETSITSGTIVGNLIAANTIVGDKIQANTVDVDRFKTNTGIAGIIYVGSDDSPTGTNRIVLDGASTLPKIYYGSGVYNNSNTPFYIDAAGKFSLKDQLTWDGSSLTVRGSLNVTQASTMTSNLNINSGGSLIVNGGAIRVTGTAGRVEMSSLGLVGYNASTGGSPLVTIQANTGQIVATGGQIGGFTLGPTSLTTTNTSGQAVGLYSNGQFSLGSNFNISAAGDLTATGTFTIAGTGGQTAIAANQVNSNVTSISGGVITTGTINLNNVLVNSGSGTVNTMKLSSSGLEIYNSSGTRTVFLTPSGNASFNGEITSTTGNIAGFSMDADGLINSGGTLRLFAGTTGINNIYSIFTSKPVRFGQYVQIQGTGFTGFSIIAEQGISLANGGLTINSSGHFSSNATFNNYIYYPGYPVSTSGGTARVNDATTPISRLVAASGSSIRFKENIVDISEKPNLDPTALLNLPVRSFTYKSDYLPEDDARYGMDLPGFIAEELEEVYPIAVDRDSDGTPQRWNSDFLIPGLLKIVQLQNDSIVSIKARLDALES